MLLALDFLRFIMLVSRCTSLPNTANLRSQIKSIAQTTIVQIGIIKERWPMDNRISLVPPTSPPIQGLASIHAYLLMLEKELQSTGFESLGQIQANVSILGGHVGSLARVIKCPRGAQNAGDFQSLRVPGKFQESQSSICLEMVQRYMEKLTNNMDKLSTC